jgi:flagellar basal body-associated protein FliL
MKQRILNKAVLALTLVTMGCGTFTLWKFKKSVDSLKTLPDLYGAHHENSKEQGSAQMKVAKNTGHGETEKAAGGHGEASSAKGEHGEVKKPEGGHGSSEPGRTPASVVSQGVPLVSVDELFVNVNSDKGAHLMAVKLDLELFEDSQRGLIKTNQSVIKDRIIEISRGFEYERLNSLGGKLYFKELVVSEINKFLGQALIKNAHISSFYLQ